MPVVVERSGCQESAIGVGVPRGSSESQQSGLPSLDIGLINNMPDSAVESTERQFVDVLNAASENVTVRLRLFTLPDVPRSETMRLRLRNSYTDIAHLWNLPFDGLIVTGTEPRATYLKDEPYWPAVTKIADWAEEAGVSTVWSCLAAHAAVLHLDGINRHPLVDKCFGTFDCANVSNHYLLNRMPSTVRIPHSRWNELHESDLLSAGYMILTKSAEAGVDLFVRQRRSLSIFFQGHPEYDPRALLREYRRDIGRYLAGQRETYPSMPKGYVDDKAVDILMQFRTQAMMQQHESFLTQFPTPLVEKRLLPGSASAAAGVYGNWLLHLAAEKAPAGKSKPLSRWSRPGPAGEVQTVLGVG